MHMQVCWTCKRRVYRMNDKENYEHTLHVNDTIGQRVQTQLVQTI